jgi:copper chaperone
MKIEFKIERMSCQHCVMAVRKEIMKLPIENLEVKIGEATVEFDNSKVTIEKIKESIAEAGYSVIEE